MNGNRIRLHGFDECRELDRLSQAAGIEEVQLMGQAALASLYSMEKHILTKPQNTIQRILILCGPGNNGGDGLALAYLLLDRKRVRSVPHILVFHSSGQVKTPAAHFYAQRLSEAGLALHKSADFLQESINAQDLVVEALLGTGQSSAPRGSVLDMLLHVRQQRCQPTMQDRPALLSLDLPAGLSEGAPAAFLPPGSPVKEEKPDTGMVLAAPDEIHCYGVDKTALALSACLCAYSQIRLLSIGFHPKCSPKPQREVWRFPTCTKHALSPTEQALFCKDPLGHKYNAGHGLLIGGSVGMEGALLMAARAFFASGGGILHALVPDPISRQILIQAMPALMCHTRETLPEDIRPGSILIGPGLKADDIVLMQPFIQSCIKKNQAQAYFILDAAATRLALSLPELPAQRTLLLPHSGEWRALGGTAIRDTLSLYTAMDFYKSHFKCWVLVKDSVCVLFSMNPTKTVEAALYSRPKAALSTAGSGDNLAGIILSLLAKKNPKEAKDSKAREGDATWTQDRIFSGLNLLHAALAQRINPRSDEFADAIEKILVPKC